MGLPRDLPGDGERALMGWPKELRRRWPVGAVLSFCMLCLLLAAGKLLRVKVKLFQWLYLPSSVIGGILGLTILQAGGDIIPAAWTAGWNALPGLLINVVFATLFLGVFVPPLKTIWSRSAPQLAYGQIVAWGQYVVGLGLVLLVLRPLFGTPGLFGVIVPVGFEGGHGTAGGLAPVFSELGWNEGKDYALASATVGIVSAIVAGMALINWAARRGFVTRYEKTLDRKEEDLTGFYPPQSCPSAGRQTVSPSSVDALALHLAIVGIAILVGVLIKNSLAFVETGMQARFGSPDADAFEVMRAFPLFPLCMIGGLAVQATLQKCARVSPVDHGLMQRIGGTALDFLVVAAISKIRLEVIAEGFLPFALIMAAAVAWNVFCVMWLARRLLPNCWFERAIAEMGQSMGVTATGLLLLRAVDPEGDTDAPSAFGYKQLLHEPFMGGGLWTTSAVLLVAHHGPWPIFAVSVGAILAWLLVWRLLLRKPGG